MNTEAASFTDSAGRTWRLALSVARVRALKAVGVDVANLGGGQVFSDLATDWMKLADALWALCREQADEAGVSEDDFGAVLDAETLTAASQAFEEAVVGFSPADKRPSVRALIARAKAATARSDAQAVALIESDATTAMIDRKLQEAADQAKRKLLGDD